MQGEGDTGGVCGLSLLLINVLKITRNDNRLSVPRRVYQINRGLAEEVIDRGVVLSESVASADVRTLYPSQISSLHPQLKFTFSPCFLIWYLAAVPLEGGLHAPSTDCVQKPSLTQVLLLWLPSCSSRRSLTIRDDDLDC